MELEFRNILKPTHTRNNINITKTVYIGWRRQKNISYSIKPFEERYRKVFLYPKSRI